MSTIHYRIVKLSEGSWNEAVAIQGVFLNDIPFYILSFGPVLKVIEPDDFRKKVADRILKQNVEL